MRDAEKEALRKVYNAMLEAQEEREYGHEDAGEWLFWKDFNEIKIKIWNKIGCP